MAEATSCQQLKEGGSLLSILCPRRIFLWLTRAVQKLAQVLLMAQVWGKRARGRLTLILSVQKLLRWSMSKRFRASLTWAGGDEGNKNKGLPANHPPTAAQWRSPWAKAAAGLLKEALGHWEKNHWPSWYWHKGPSSSFIGDLRLWGLWSPRRACGPRGPQGRCLRPFCPPNTSLACGKSGRGREKPVNS